MARAPFALALALAFASVPTSALAQAAEAPPPSETGSTDAAPPAAEVPADDAAADTGEPATTDEGTAADDSTATDAPSPTDAAPADAAPADAAPADDAAATDDGWAEEDPLLADSGDSEDDDFLALDITQSDEPTILERQIVAIVASGVTVVALIAGATFGALSYIQYQCAADVIQCNENLAEPIVGDQLFEARANVEQLALLADMAYLFAAASALVAITGFVRGFFFTGESNDDAPPEVDEGGFEDAGDSAPAEGGGVDDDSAVPAAEPAPSASASPTRALRTVSRALTPTRAFRGSLVFEVE